MTPGTAQSVVARTAILTFIARRAGPGQSLFLIVNYEGIETNSTAKISCSIAAKLPAVSAEEHIVAPVFCP